MKAWVCGILKLLGHKTAVNLFCQVVTTIDCSLHSGVLRHVLYFAPEDFNQLHFFDCKSSRDAQNHAISLCDADECQTDTSVSSRWFNDCRTRTQFTLALRLKNHSQSCTILNGTTWIHPFNFCKDAGKWWWRKTRKMKKGSVTDKIKNAVCRAENHKLLPICDCRLPIFRMSDELSFVVRHGHEAKYNKDL